MGKWTERDFKNFYERVQKDAIKEYINRYEFKNTGIYESWGRYNLFCPRQAHWMALIDETYFYIDKSKLINRTNTKNLYNTNLSDYIADACKADTELQFIDNINIVCDNREKLNLNKYQAGYFPDGKPFYIYLNTKYLKLFSPTLNISLMIVNDNKLKSYPLVYVYAKEVLLGVICCVRHNENNNK